jgi:hypothetical protein
LDAKLDQLEKKTEKLTREEKELEDLKNEVRDIRTKQHEKLEKIAGLSKSDAREKLMKMTELFGITLDELVTGATKEEPVAPPPQETPGPQAKRMLTTQQIIGIVLLGFGGLCFIVFTVVGIFTGNLLLGLFTGLPLMLCGLICLVYKKNIGLKCAWAVYLPLWVLFTIFLAR